MILLLTFLVMLYKSTKLYIGKNSEFFIAVLIKEYSIGCRYTKQQAEIPSDIEP